MVACRHIAILSYKFLYLFVCLWPLNNSVHCVSLWNEFQPKFFCLCSRKHLLVKYFYVIWQTSALSEWLFLKGYVKLRLFFCIDSFFWKGISKGLNMDLYLWERSYWVRTTTALSEREDISIEHGLLLVKRMTLEAERIYEQKFRLKFGHLESELTRWRVWHSFIHPFIYSFTMHSFVLNSFIHTYKTQRNFSFHDVRMFMMIT